MRVIAHAVAAAIFFGGPIVLALALILLLSGCGQRQTQVIWNKEGATEQQFVADRYECVRDAVMTGGTTYIGFGFTERRADPRMFVHCMIARGYTPSRG
jgi:hypothetical protein